MFQNAQKAVPFARRGFFMGLLLTTLPADLLGLFSHLRRSRVLDIVGSWCNPLAVMGFSCRRGFDHCANLFGRLWLLPRGFHFHLKHSSQ
jgi:hypothetical protein